MVLKDIESTLLGGGELDDVLEAQITSLPADHLLTGIGISLPIGNLNLHSYAFYNCFSFTISCDGV